MSVMKIKILLGATTPVLKTITVLKKASSSLKADWLTWKLINHGIALMDWRWELFKELENKYRELL